MSNDKLSLETRVSSAFVQGQLEEAMKAHADCECTLDGLVEQIINEWKQAEAELAGTADIAARDAADAAADATEMGGK